MGARLHLIHPLGFQLDEKALKRAGLDYHEWAAICEHENYSSFINDEKPARIIACTTKATQFYHELKFTSDEYLLFGPESRGLPKELLDALPSEQKIRIPMQAVSRSLNLSNAVAIIAYEAWRQLGFHPQRP
jgi:tRNA (cytidine/uridine-2'-O-)-methyltransferase